MLILQAGVPRSGNLWLYRIIEEMTQRAGIERASFIRQHSIYPDAMQWEGFSDQAGIDYLHIAPDGIFFQKGNYRERILDLTGYLAQCTHVWTHSPWVANSESVLEQFDKVMYIIRDPRDIAISASFYAFSPFMKFQHPHKEPDPDSYLRHRLTEILIGWVNHVGAHLLQRDKLNIHTVFYEDLLSSFDAELLRIADYLGLKLSASDLLDVADEVNFDRMHHENPHHVRKGKYRQWVRSLTAKQKQNALRVAGPMLTELNYPEHDVEIGTKTPRLPINLDKRNVLRMIRESRGDYRAKFYYAREFAQSKRPIIEKIRKGFDYLLKRGVWNLKGD